MEYVILSVRYHRKRSNTKIFEILLKLFKDNSGLVAQSVLINEKELKLCFEYKSDTDYADIGFYLADMLGGAYRLIKGQ